MTEATRGILAMVLACTIWGLSPLYYNLLAHVPPLEVLAHRTLWSLVFFGVVLTLQRRLGAVLSLMAGRQVIVVFLSALVISVNWFLFIFSVQAGHVMEASLGYYIFPLFAVALGAIVFGERLGRVQKAAVTMAVLAVVLLTWGLGVAPWIALALGATFAFYGVAKKRLAAGPVVSVTAEVALLAPFALIWLAVLHTGTGGAFASDPMTSGLLALSGVLTAGPLILFSYASRRVTMATLGLTQYLNPTLQFLCATLVFGEAFTPWHMAAFALIWTALALYSAAAWRQEKASRRTASSVSTSATRPT